MIRLLIFALFLFHGLIHLIGFAKEFGYGFAAQLNRKFINLSPAQAKIAGVGWMLASVIFIFGGIIFLLRKDWYWMPAVIALTVSQILIILYWHDAKFGTIANLIVLVIVILGIAEFRLNSQFKSIALSLENNSVRDEIVVGEGDVQSLPEPVQRWLRVSGVVGNSHSNSVHVLQKGNMRLKPDAAWMSFQAEEYFTIDPPSFVWKADIQASPFVRIAGLDRYENGEGNMIIKPYALFAAADKKGTEMDQGSLLRFLAEMIWFPQASVSDYLHWEAIDSKHARVTMTYRQTTASGIFTFNDEGFVSGFEANRFGDFDGDYKLETWSVNVSDIKPFEGKRIGALSEVSWKLKEGDFLWMEMEVTEIHSAPR